MKTPQLKKPGLVKSALLNWLGIPLSLTDTDAWSALTGGGASTAGQRVTTDSMLRLSAVWACARLISQCIGSMPLSMYERTGGGKRVAQQHPLHMILHDQPNADTTAALHWEATVAAMLLRGNARAEKLMIGQRVVGLQFLHPARLVIRRNAAGQKTYWYTEINGRQREIPAARIWNVPGFSLDGVDGVSVVGYGSGVFGAAQAAEAAASGTFARGLMPTTYFKYPKVLSKDQREDARDFIENRLSGAINAGKPAILEAEMDVGNIGIDPSDAQLLESRAFSVEEICRWFGVPPHMVGHSEKSTSWGTGIEQQVLGFLTFTLTPWLRRIEQAISKDLLSPAERLRFYPKFNVEGLLRADSAGRSAFYGAMVDKGIYTRDEVREKEDLPPMGGNAAVLMAQTAMAPLDSLGQTTVDQQAKNALASWLRDE